MIHSSYLADIENIIGHCEYTIESLCPEMSSNDLFKISVHGVPYVLKIYKQLNCFDNELNFMHRFGDNKCKVPRLIGYGSSHMRPWIMYEYVEGINLYKAKDVLPKESLYDVWIQIGKELKKIHSTSVMNEANTEESKIHFIHQVTSKIEYLRNCISESVMSPIIVDAIEYLEKHSSHTYQQPLHVILYDVNDKHIILRQTTHKWQFSAFIDFEQTCFGSPYIDIAGLYISSLFANKEIEKYFWIGYANSRHSNIDYQSICFFLIYFGLELCTVLQNINTNNYNTGLSIINTAFNLKKHH
jgi:aminoglycoside phosphotransferase (APT) family kinase protein